MTRFSDYVCKAILVASFVLSAAAFVLLVFCVYNIIVGV